MFQYLINNVPIFNKKGIIKNYYVTPVLHKKEMHLVMHSQQKRITKNKWPIQITLCEDFNKLV